MDSKVEQLSPEMEHQWNQLIESQRKIVRTMTNMEKLVDWTRFDHSVHETINRTLRELHEFLRLDPAESSPRLDSKPDPQVIEIQKRWLVLREVLMKLALSWEAAEPQISWLDADAATRETIKQAFATLKAVLVADSFSGIADTGETIQ